VLRLLRTPIDRDSGINILTLIEGMEEGTLDQIFRIVKMSQSWLSSASFLHQSSISRLDH